MCLGLRWLTVSPFSPEIVESLEGLGFWGLRSLGFRIWGLSGLGPLVTFRVQDLGPLGFRVRGRTLHLGSRIKGLKEGPLQGTLAAM